MIDLTGLGTTEIADSIGKTGWMPGLNPLCEGPSVFGKAMFVYSGHGTNWYLHEQIRRAERNSIVYIFMFDSEGKACLGELIADYLFIHLGIKGLIVDGLIRDIPGLKSKKYPIWSRGNTPIGCINNKIEFTANDYGIIRAQEEKLRDAIFVADDSGVVVVTKEHQIDFQDKVETIRERERSWFARLANGESTFDIVCRNKPTLSFAPSQPDQ